MSSDKKNVPAWVNFVIGGTCGMMATCFVQPNDLLKTRMQLMGPAVKNESMISVGRAIIKREGGRGLYKGLSAALFRQATYSTGRLGVFNTAFNHYKTKYGVPNLPTKLLFGMTAGGVGAFIGNPAEVCLIRMTADGRLPPERRRNYTNVFNALGRITKEEGLKTLWRGTSSTVTRAMVVNGAQLATYSQAREMLLPSIGEGVPLHFTASMIAGLITSTASLPVDIVKTRVQNAAIGTGQLAVLKGLIANEGFMALWSGFLPTYLKIGPHTVMTFIFMEQLNKLYFTLAEYFGLVFIYETLKPKISCCFSYPMKRTRTLLTVYKEELTSAFLSSSSSLSPTSSLLSLAAPLPSSSSSFLSSK